MRGTSASGTVAVSAPVGLSDGRRLGVGEHHARNGVVVRGPVASEDVRGGHAALVLAHVGERPDAGRVADRPQPVRDAHPVVHRDPLSRGLHADACRGRGRRRAHGARSPRAAGRRAARRGRRTRRTYSSPSRRTPVACSPKWSSMPSAGERVAERVAERLRLARQEVVHALDQRHRRAQAVHGLRHLHSHRAATQHEQPARDLGEPRDLAVRPDAFQLAEAGDGRHHGVRPGRDHDVVRGVGLAVHLDAARAGQARGPANQLDALSLEPRRLGAVLVVPDHEVAPLEGALRQHPSAHGLAGARRLARRLERLAGPQQRLRRDAGPVVALAPDELAFDDRHAKAAVREPAGAVLTCRTGTDDDDIEFLGAAHRDLSSGGDPARGGISAMRGRRKLSR